MKFTPITLIAFLTSAASGGSIGGFSGIPAYRAPIHSGQNFKAPNKPTPCAAAVTPLIGYVASTDQLSLSGSHKIFPESDKIELSKKPSYLSATIRPSEIVNPPPLRGSPAYLQDFSKLQTIQKNRTNNDVARAKLTEDEALSWKSFEGPETTFLKSTYFLESIAPLMQFSEGQKAQRGKVHQDIWLVALALKNYYHRPRPHTEEPFALNPMIRKNPDSWSYPSTHATLAYGFAALLTALDPDKTNPQKYFSKAQEITMDREVLGVHHPSDITAGEAAGRWAAEQILKSPHFQQDIKGKPKP